MSNEQSPVQEKILTKNQKELYLMAENLRGQLEEGDFKGLISSIAAAVNNKSLHFIENNNKILVSNLSRDYMQKDVATEKDVQDFINAVKELLR